MRNPVALGTLLSFFAIFLVLGMSNEPRLSNSGSLQCRLYTIHMVVAFNWHGQKFLSRLAGVRRTQGSDLGQGCVSVA